MPTIGYKVRRERRDPWDAGKDLTHNTVEKQVREKGQQPAVLNVLLLRWHLHKPAWTAGPDHTMYA